MVWFCLFIWGRFYFHCPVFVRYLNGSFKPSVLHFILNFCLSQPQPSLHPILSLQVFVLPLSLHLSVLFCVASSCFHLMVSGILWGLQEILNKTPALFFFQKDPVLPQGPLDDFGGTWNWRECLCKCLAHSARDERDLVITYYTNKEIGSHLQGEPLCPPMKLWTHCSECKCLCVGHRAKELRPLDSEGLVLSSPSVPRHCLPVLSPLCRGHGRESPCS